MKYAVIIPDGAADEPIKDLGDRTVLESADIPTLNELARTGQLGMVRMVPDDMTAGSDVAIMSVLGYDPKKYYTGRATIEAAAMGIEPTDDQIMFRCNLVTIIDSVMEDFSAGHITSNESKTLIDCLNAQLGGDNVSFHAGISYRHIMVTSPADAFAGLKTTPPHDIMGQPVKRYLPKGSGADRINDLMSRSVDILETHEINQIRRELGDNCATSIWLWGQGQKPTLDPFKQLYNLSGAIICGVDLIRGLATLIGWRIIDVPGATGYLDTDYAGKGRAACAALDDVDLVTVHVEAPDEAGHNGDAQAKKLAVERIDHDIVAPIVAKLKQFDAWRIMVLPDHPTPVSVRSHSGGPVPFVIAGSDISTNRGEAFNEPQARRLNFQVDPGWQLMQYFLRP